MMFSIYVRLCDVTGGMSYSGLVGMRVFGMLVVDPKFTVANWEVLPNRPTRVIPFKCELVRFALRRRIAHLNRINSGRATTKV